MKITNGEYSVYKHTKAEEKVQAGIYGSLSSKSKSLN